MGVGSSAASATGVRSDAMEKATVPRAHSVPLPTSVTSTETTARLRPRRTTLAVASAGPTVTPRR